MRRAILTFALLALAPLAALAQADPVTLTVGARHKMRAILYRPNGPGPYPAVLVLHASSGLTDRDTTYAVRLAGLGYVALVPAFMEAYGLTEASRRETFTVDAQAVYDDLVAALDTLAHDTAVSAGKFGAVGFSNGGYFAAWLAATGKVKASVAYYGAYTGAGSDRSLARFRSAFEAGSAPLLILHGKADGTVPVEFAEKIAAIARGAGSPVEIQLYDGVGHGFDRQLVNPVAKAATDDSWARSQMFFAKYLK
jgi:carboxymethylenebutenolidase